MKTKSTSTTDIDFISGGGEMGERIRSFNWSDTLLGHVTRWPQSLQSALSICINSNFPIAIYWGPDLVLLYNDAWSPIPGNKHPWALGRPAKEVWPEIWNDIGPLFDEVFEKHIATGSKDGLLPMERHGYIEECYFDFTFTPIYGEHGKVDGIFNAVIETTYRVINERRAAILQRLNIAINSLSTSEEVIRKASDVFDESREDIPFFFIYTISKEGYPVLASKSSDVSENSILKPWPFEGLSTTGLWPVRKIRDHLKEIPKGYWPELPKDFVLLPLKGTDGMIGYFVAGISSRRNFDKEYQLFFESISNSISGELNTITSLHEERKRAEALAEIDRVKTAFFSNISHEFRTPLTLMLSPLEEILDLQDGLPGHVRENIAISHRNTLRLQKLVNTLLDFSRIEAGRVQAQFTKVDIGAFTEELASSFRSAIEKEGMKLVVNLEPIEGDVYVDTEMWEKIVLNLISNAFKYSLEGSIHVSIKQNGTFVDLSVTDTGSGIPEDEIEKIFDRFHRSRNTMGRSQEGTGIGLSMVRELVKLHGGTINVSSKKDVGSTFTVSIPRGNNHLHSHSLFQTNTLRPSQAKVYLQEASLWNAEDTSNSEGRQADTNSAGDNSAHKPFTVLLADDNADMRKYIQRLLSSYFNVISVHDGVAAFEKALAEKPDIILTDIMMPNLDGFGLLKKLRSNLSTRNIPVVFLSARAGEEAKVEGLNAGADDYLVKPFSSKELLARVGNHIAISRVRRQTEKEFFNLFLQSPARIHVFEGPDHVLEFFHPLGIPFAGRDITGMKVREGLPQLEGKGFFEILDQVYQQGITVHSPELKTTYKNNNGELEEHYFDTTTLPWKDLDGKVKGVLQFIFDVTETVQQRLKAQAAEQKFRSIAQQAPIAMAVLKGPDHIVEVANDRVLELWGRKYEEVINRSVLDVFPEIIAQGFKDLLRKVFTTGEPFFASEMPVTFMRPEGNKKIFVNLLYEPFRNENKEIEGIVAVGIDVTDQVISRKLMEEAEYRIKNAIELAELGTWSIYLKEDKVEYSPRVAQWWGLQETGATLDQVIRCIHEEDRKKVEDEITAAISGKSSYEAEYRLLHATTKQERVIHATGKIVYDDNNEPLRLSGIVRDVTLEKMAQRELEQQVALRTKELQETNNDLIRSNENLRQFAYVASHDLQEPLRKILIYSDLILQRNKANNQMIGREYLDKIAIGSQRMSFLIRDLLQYSQAERKDDLYTLVDLNEILNNIREDFEVTIEERNAEIEVGPLCSIEAIQLQMNQLFYNLIGNALKFSRQNERAIININSSLISEAEKERAGLDKTISYCEIKIKDNGIGFEQKYADQIFVLFQRLHMRDEYDGTGIGLALCKKIVENHKGLIYAESKLGEGSLFRVVLPLTRI